MGCCRLRRRLLFFLFIAGYFFCLAAFAEGKLGDGLPEGGRALYRMSCAACHGADGRGASAGIVGFDTPLPDFTDCNFSTREAQADWVIVVMEGGAIRGFSEIMPAFGDALSEEQITKILTYIRSLSDCSEWPRGEFNLPRALYTTKAFPEDEIVFHSDIKTDGLDKISNKFVYEHRISARNQIEVVVPYGWNTIEPSSGGGKREWVSAVGDVKLGAKRVLFHNLSSGSIFSVGGEVSLPTGDEDEDFGKGTTVLEPYFAFGQILPEDYFVQLQGGVEWPCDDDPVQEEAFWKMATGRTFAVGRFESAWSPMVEILGSKHLSDGDDAHWDIVPQIQIALNKRQHVLLAIGMRIPMNDRTVREPLFGVYLLWDMFDGGFFEGW